MHIIDDIAYADEELPNIKVCKVRPLDGYKLWLRFTTGEEKIFDFAEMLKTPAFTPLKDKKRFDAVYAVYIDFGAPTWENGSIDIDPAYLYENAAEKI